MREGLDYSTALFDDEGAVTQGDQAGHLGSMAFTVRHVLAEYPRETMQPGDAILLNNSGIGSGHLPDFFMISPIHLDGVLIGFAVDCAHHVDVGGSGAGSQVIEGIQDNYQEGIRFLPTRCYVAGEPVQDILRHRCECAATREGDRRSARRVNANNTGVRRVQELARLYGREVLRDTMAEIMARSEAQIRAGRSARSRTAPIASRIAWTMSGRAPSRWWRRSR